jgi:hypothetical protein
MISVVIKDDGEPKVIELTYQNLWKELKDIKGAELLVSPNPLQELGNIKNKYICFVEADCLVSSGYFSSMIGLFRKNPASRRSGMLASGIGVGHWGNRFYGYEVVKFKGESRSHVQPVKEKKSRYQYTVQIGYVPGAIINAKMLRELEGLELDFSNLIRMSTDISLAFWRMGDGHSVSINPNTTYVTTEDYVNDLGSFDPNAGDLKELFKRHGL